MPKYLVAVTFEPGTDPTPMEEWTEAEVEAHLAAYGVIMDDVEARGELVDSIILSGPDSALLVRGQGPAVSVDRGPFGEVNDWLAGFQIFDVENEARVIEIAEQLSSVPGYKGLPTNQVIHIRPLYEETPTNQQEMSEYFGDKA